VAVSLVCKYENAGNAKSHVWPLADAFLELVDVA
jgi:hypothetical protein